MKQFLKNIVFFLLGIILISAINWNVNYLIIKNSEIKLNSSEILIIGDSHTKRGINPVLFNNAQNISQAAEPYLITFWKLKSVINKIDPDTVLIGFSPHNISNFNDLKFSDKTWSHEMFKRSYLIQDFKSLGNIPIDYYGYYTFLFKQLCLFPRLNHIHYIGKHKQSTESNISDVESVINRHYYFNNQKPGVSKIAINYLDSIINLCISNNIVPILINTPVHNTYKTKIPKEIQKDFIFEINKWSSKDIKVINYESTKYHDTFFFDSDHLNNFGAAHFTTTLIQLIREKN
jgi:hypothetical protein